jgi:hypothetical protein
MFTNVCEISSSHGGEYEVQNCLLGCTAVHPRRQVWTFTNIVRTKMRGFWDIALCSLVGPVDGGSTHLWNVSLLQADDTAPHPRRLSSSYSLPCEREVSLLVQFRQRGKANHCYSSLSLYECAQLEHFISILFVVSKWNTAYSVDGRKMLIDPLKPSGTTCLIVGTFSFYP